MPLMLCGSLHKCCKQNNREEDCCVLCVGRGRLELELSCNGMTCRMGLNCIQCRKPSNLVLLGNLSLSSASPEVTRSNTTSAFVCSNRNKMSDSARSGRKLQRTCGRKRVFFSGFTFIRILSFSVQCCDMASASDIPNGLDGGGQSGPDVSREDILKQIFGDIGKLVEGQRVVVAITMSILPPTPHRFYMCSGEHSLAAWAHVHHEQVHLLLLQPLRSGEEDPHPLLAHQEYYEGKHCYGHSKCYRYLHRCACHPKLPLFL